jgi:predicted GNAT family acetyltransferase
VTADEYVTAEDSAARAVLEVVHVPARSRYELREDGALLGVAEYVARGEVLHVHHTEIIPARRNHGLGEQLVAGMLADVRERGGRVVPTCWFVADYFRDHPEAADLRA